MQPYIPYQSGARRALDERFSERERAFNFKDSPTKPPALVTSIATRTMTHILFWFSISL